MTVMRQKVNRKRSLHINFMTVDEVINRLSEEKQNIIRWYDGVNPDKILLEVLSYKDDSGIANSEIRLAFESDETDDEMKSRLAVDELMKEVIEANENGFSKLNLQDSRLFYNSNAKDELNKHGVELSHVERYDENGKAVDFELMWFTLR